MRKLLIIFLFIVILIGVGYFLWKINDRVNNTKEDKEIENSILAESSNIDEKGEEKMKIYINVNGEILEATLEDNSSTRELYGRLKKEDISIEMNDYANMEKVGDLGFNLPTNDENLSTKPGDLILYQGNSFVIYYGENNWELTKLGKIDNIGKEELIKILGEGKVIVNLSISK